MNNPRRNTFYDYCTKQFNGQIEKIRISIGYCNCDKESTETIKYIIPIGSIYLYSVHVTNNSSAFNLLRFVTIYYTITHAEAK